MNGRFTLACLLTLVLATTVVGQVKVDKTPVTVATKYFDPKKPPAEMPKLQPNEAAVCVSNFRISASAGGDITADTAASGGARASVKIDKINVTLGCDVVIWLPNKAPKKIIEHEDGHRVITERFYASADTTATNLAQAWIGRTVVGDGKDTQSAARSAIQSAIQQMSGQYMSAVHGESSEVQENYDRITVHGTNKLTAKQGVDKALGEWERAKR